MGTRNARKKQNSRSRRNTTVTRTYGSTAPRTCIPKRKIREINRTFRVDYYLIIRVYDNIISTVTLLRRISAERWAEFVRFARIKILLLVYIGNRIIFMIIILLYYVYTVYTARTWRSRSPRRRFRPESADRNGTFSMRYNPWQSSVYPNEIGFYRGVRCLVYFVM